MPTQHRHVRMPFWRSPSADLTSITIADRWFAVGQATVLGDFCEVAGRMSSAGGSAWKFILSGHSVHMCLQVYTAKLTLVDLAGSERASDTNNTGKQLRDGASINKCVSQLHCVLCTWTATAHCHSAVQVTAGPSQLHQCAWQAAQEGPQLPPHQGLKADQTPQRWPLRQVSAAVKLGVAIPADGKAGQ